MCPHCRAFITTDDKVCPYCDAQVGPRSVDVRSPRDLLGGAIPHARFTTTVILTINIGLYIACMLFSMRGGNEGAFMNLDGGTLLAFGAKHGALIFHEREYWRLITAGFLHGGMLHILMNSWVLFDLGAQVEEVFGTSRMIPIYFVSTVAGFLASTFWSPNVPSVGASAGIFGLMGAMIAFGMKHRSALGDATRSMYIRWAMFMLVIGLFGFQIDNAAHIGGLAGGFAVAWIADIPSLVARPMDRIWTFIMYACLALTGAAFIEMFLAFRNYGPAVMSL
jgi:rhomboid protease GluP